MAVGRQKSLDLLNYLDEENKIIGLVSQRDGSVEEPGQNDLYEWGTASMILKKFKMPDGSEQLIVQGMYRIKILNILKYGILSAGLKIKHHYACAI